LKTLTAQQPTFGGSLRAIAALHLACVLGLLVEMVAFGLPIADARDVPSRAVVATVLSQSIYADQLEPTAAERQAIGANRDGRSIASLRARRLEALIVTPLRKLFCANHDCKATPEETRAFAGVMAASTATNGSDVHERRDARRIARDFIETWKFHKALQGAYGGEVIWQVLGPNAVGARRRWLEAEESAGHFRIFTTDLRTAFYEAVGGYGGNPVPAEEATDAFLHPLWEAAPAGAAAREAAGTTRPSKATLPSSSPTKSEPTSTAALIRISCDGTRSAIVTEMRTIEEAAARHGLAIPTPSDSEAEGPSDDLDDRPFSRGLQRMFDASTLNPEAKAVADACLDEIRALEHRRQAMLRSVERARQQEGAAPRLPE